jgi:acyl-CoA synthetase (AMP-forming)/AMP-acid ligase II
VADDLWGMIEARSAATPDAELLVHRNGERVTCAELQTRVERMALGLAAVGVRSGDVVAWEFPTWIETVVLAAALHRLGTTQVPIIAIYREREVTHCCREAGARWLITPSTFRGVAFDDMARRVSDETGVQSLVFDQGTFPDVAEGSLPPHEVRTDPRWIFYTSGTTSAPKGVRHTDAALSAVAERMGARLRLGPTDRNALVFPFPHVGGIAVFYMALHTGATHLLDDAFDPATTIPFLAAEGVTHAGTGTPFHLAYLAAQRAQPERRLFPHLRCCPGGAAPKPPTLHAQIKAELGGVGIVSSWGLTEAPILTFSTFDDPDDKLATTEGRALDGVELRLVDGELWARGPQITAGYVDSSLDADAFVDGWFRTGDLGTIDDEGFVTITGRLKDVIIRNGENVSAKEVEDLLFAHPSVADAAVVGLPDDRTGERVCAVVVGDLGFVEMREWLTEKGLRRQAMPEQLEHIEALPRNPAGKVTKKVLQERFGAAPVR